MLSNEFPNNGISSTTTENTSSTGYARLQLQTPNNIAYMQVGKGEGLLVSTEQVLPMMFSPNRTEAMRLNANGTSTFQNDMECRALHTNKNIFMERTFVTNSTYNGVLYYNYAISRSWIKIPFDVSQDNSIRGPEPYNGLSWWDSNYNAFVIRKSGVYQFKTTVGFTMFDNWTGLVGVRVVAKWIDNTTTDIYTDWLMHSEYLSSDQITASDFQYLPVGTSIWVEFYMWFPSGKYSSTATINSWVTKFKLHLLN
jgi:hypothetical protein